MLNSNSTTPVLLKDIDEGTAKFFMKAPDNNILEFILSKRVILVEGDAEFILMQAFYKNETTENFEDSDIHVISVGGTSFKRYLNLAKHLEIRTAVIRDNDGDFQKKCVDDFSDYTEPFIKVFSDTDNNVSTFEIAVFNDNSAACNELFSAGRKTLSVQDYMLSNKADCAFELLDKKADTLTTPQYIKDAITWIRQ